MPHLGRITGYYDVLLAELQPATYDMLVAEFFQGSPT
jgi:hypothetical protein